MNDFVDILDVPNSLKSGVLTPVPKKGKDACIPNNNRGIVNSCLLMKLLESILKVRVDKIFSNKQSRLQRGFTEKSGSLNAAFIVSEAINDAEINKLPLYFTTLDAQKAFDTVNHEVLFNKLYHYGIKGELWIMLRNLYRNSTVKVKWNGELSDEFLLSQGTKQGAKLSTSLYKCYNNSTLIALENSGLGAKMRSGTRFSGIWPFIGITF